jgi:uncharacterized protein YjgD (DUF1641 family)
MSYGKDAKESRSTADDMSESVSTIDPNTQKTIETIRNVASNIREAAARMRDTVRSLRQSGVIDELTKAIHESMIAARDTTQEISEIAKELREEGVIRDTATTIEETATAAREISQSARHTAKQVGESAPTTGEALRKAAERIKSRKRTELTE